MISKKNVVGRIGDDGSEMKKPERLSSRIQVRHVS
jgi:hypothetical protein